MLLRLGQWSGLGEVGPGFSRVKSKTPQGDPEARGIIKALSSPATKDLSWDLFRHGILFVFTF